MAWETALRARIKAQISGVGVYWTERPMRSDYPAVVLQTVNGVREQTLSGFQSVNQDLVQIDIFGSEREDVVALREQVIAAIAGPFLQSGVQFQRVMIQGIRDLGGSTETGFVHRDSLDVLITHN